MRTRTLGASVSAAVLLLFFGCGNSNSNSPPGGQSHAGAGGAVGGVSGAGGASGNSSSAGNAGLSSNAGASGGNAGAAGSAGAGATCSSMGASYMTCAGTCTDTASSATNCGTCGNACPAATPFCSAGTCAATCALTQCAGACVDTMTSAANCGVCGMACAAGQSCSAGKCLGGTGTRPAGCPAAPGLLSDFEEGSAVLVPQEDRTGWWYVYADTAAGTQTPPIANNAPIAVAMVDASEQATCNKYALHSTAANHAAYVGFGATLKPTGASANQKAPVDVARSTYTGLSFKIRSGAGNTPVWFEFLNRETQPGPGCSGCGDLGGTANNNAIDAYNTRGRLMNGTGAAAAYQIPSALPGKVITLPFATLAPRYLPSDCEGTVLCEAPAFNPASALGVQFSVYDQFSTTGGYDLWVDDITLVKGDAGLPTLTQTAGAAHPFPRDAAIGTCSKPTGASGKYLVEAYQNWKSTFVVASGSNFRVQRPENNNDSVSEGIAYGMLIAVYMNDKALFDGLWGFWKSHAAAGPANAPLMDWKATSGNGSATDADEDAAFALLQAGKQWSGGTYTADGTSLVKTIFANEVDGTKFLKPGNNFGGKALTNPSYFAPAYYREFAKVDSADDWASVISNTYTMLNAIAGSNGLVPAWCQNSCTSAGANGMYTDDTRYQYDSHRTPWRIALDACWNGNADARAYVTKSTGFFATQATNGMGRLVDIYQTNGTGQTGAKFNSMSIIGTAGAGALYSAGSTAAHKQFLDRAWRFLLDASYTPDPTFRGGSTGAYTYYNATVGLLTALTLSGNFNNF